MYKVLLLNKDYSFDLQGNVKKGGENIHESGRVDKMNIQLGGVECYLDVGWLSLLAHFEVALPLTDALKIRFYDCDSKLLRYRCGKLMTFNNPVKYDSKFRVVPGLTRYAVSDDGQVLSTYSGKVMTVGKGPNGYPTITVYDPDKSRYRSIGLHILVARAWVINKDPSINLVVNHLDGDKSNFLPSNLEWSTGTSNNLHARDTGLRTDNVNCRVYDISNGHITIFPSLSEAALWLGYSRNTVNVEMVVNGVRRPKLLKGRYYVIRDDGDFKDVDIKDLINAGGNVGPYEALNVTDKSIIVAPTIPKLSKLINVSAWNTHQALIKGSDYVTGGYQIRSVCSLPWPEPKVRRVSNLPVSIVATRDGVVKKFTSIREALTYFKCDKSTITRRIKDPSVAPYEGWSFVKDSI